MYTVGTPQAKTFAVPFTFTLVSMTTLMEHNSTQPRECSFMPTKMMSTNDFFI